MGQVGQGQGVLHIGWDWGRGVFRLSGTGWDSGQVSFQLNQSTSPKVGLQGRGKLDEIY